LYIFLNDKEQKIKKFANSKFNLKILYLGEKIDSNYNEELNSKVSKLIKDGGKLKKINI
jgi:hypothetical protein